MSTNRRGKWGPKGTGPNGRPLCYCGCGREVAASKRTTFESKCYREWAAKHDPATQRRLVHKRDRGVCALCGVNTQARQRESQEWWRVFQWLARRDPEISALPAWDAYALANQEADAECARRFGAAPTSGHTWEADHIVPVVEGGGECDLSNLRTLCLACHRAETAKLARRRAERRRMQAKPAPEPTLFDLPTVSKL